MAMSRDRNHIVISSNPSVEGYRPHGRAIRPVPPPAPDNRTVHGNRLKSSLLDAGADQAARRNTAGIQVRDAVPGIYVEFNSQPDVPLKVESLENRGQGIEVVAFSKTLTADQPPRTIEHVTVLVPDGKLKYFVNRFEKYALTTPKQPREQRYEDVFDRVAELRLATLRALWTDHSEDYPASGNSIWWEVWLRRKEGKELERFFEFARLLNLMVSSSFFSIDDRTVVLVKATTEELSKSIDVLSDLAELRLARQTPYLFDKMSTPDQGEWTLELVDRVQAPARGAPAVCVLDTGMNSGHPLLAKLMDPSDCYTYNASWGVHDHHGHGTEMGGLCGLGDLTPLLSSTHSVPITHRLESVKILPPRGNNAPEVYGAIMADAVAQVETNSPFVNRCFSMAVTSSDQRDRGQPTSWSAAIDALAAGRSFDQTEKGLVYLTEAGEQRLFIVSAGNVQNPEIEHLARCDVEPIEDPGQAWNALTVGAFTAKCLITDPSYANWLPVAPLGSLSPWSTTSVIFEPAWPIKPDVVFEGGNLAFDTANNVDYPLADLSLLTTNSNPTQALFTLSWATSAACAEGARFSRQIASEYPNFWPETIRGLIVHSAEWTREMQTHFGGVVAKRQRERLVRRFGFGVPNLQKALRSAANALTLIVQGTIHPYENGKMREMHVHELPWPNDVLANLEDTIVRLRVTLSYFVEPNPARRGWKKRHRYASHGLRFDVKQPTESLDAFRKRLNERALAEEEGRPDTSTDSSEWFLGEQGRQKGSLHNDIWEGTARDLAERGVIGIFPIGGWWKEQPQRDRSAIGARYSLVVSIETDANNVDIWTPVANKVGIVVST